MAFGDRCGRSKLKKRRTPAKSSEVGNPIPASKNSSKMTTSPTHGSKVGSAPESLASILESRQSWIALLNDSTVQMVLSKTKVGSVNFSEGGRKS
ncbi:hypothetical protein GUJ93_ZPchr0005g14919 [Zizania palustris]|uniref:Uncharacterized protein n=1 Tax=Zizania palustris TaxID=103762 RepID=A0A8J5SME4_ZIZPA|nr:hypothetical protein GUJ93_ZPchr0005g14919 [Zizania palustris]